MSFVFLPMAYTQNVAKFFYYEHLKDCLWNAQKSIKKKLYRLNNNDGNVLVMQIQHCCIYHHIANTKNLCAESTQRCLLIAKIMQNNENYKNISVRFCVLRGIKTGYSQVTLWKELKQLRIVRPQNCPLNASRKGRSCKFARVGVILAKDAGLDFIINAEISMIGKRTREQLRLFNNRVDTIEWNF